MRLMEQEFLDLLGLVSPLGILTLVVYLGYRMFDRLVVVVDKHLAEIERLAQDYLDIIRTTGHDKP